MKNLKKILLVLLIIILATVVGIFIVRFENNVVENEDVVNETIEKESKENNIDNNEFVIIKNGKINDESKINNFIDKMQKRREIKEKISIKIKQYNEDKCEEIEISYTPGKENFREEIEKGTTYIESIVKNDFESRKEEYGYYTIIKNKNEEEKEEYPEGLWHIEKYTDEKNNINIILNTYAEVTEFPKICSYSLKSSNYKEEFKLIFNQRKDMGIKTIINKDENEEYDFSTYTFGGDVEIIINGDDTIYTLEKAIEEKIITVQDILDKCSKDEKYGVCKVGHYKDGGSIEYRYEEYTILKLNTLDNEKDLVIGFRGSFINEYNKLKEK